MGRTASAPKGTYTSAELARSFGSAADVYERGRPGWPAEALAWLTKELELAPQARIVDLGAGTGKLTRALTERFDYVVAVEPLTSLRRRLEALAPRAEAVAGTAERIPVANGTVEAVFAGEAFHWFDGERALAEIARVLRPSGGLALLWNVPQETKPAPPSEVPELLDRLRLEAKPPRTRYGSFEWKRSFEQHPFEELRAARFSHVVELDRRGLLAYYASQSYVAVLPEKERTAVLEELGGAIADGVYGVSFRTDAYWTRLVRTP